VNVAEISARLAAGGLALAFDTNALFSDRALIAVCSDVARVNDRLSRRGLRPLRLLTSAVAHAEKLVDLKQKYKATFDAGVILRGLASKGLEIQDFTTDHALETATRLGERHTTTDDWRAAKKKRCLQCLGLGTDTLVTASGKGCGATVDWLIGGHARAEGCVLVTDDTGPEFAGLVDRVKLETLAEALRALLQEPT
jgi:predicted nucleic acid-binding protein